MEQSLYIVRHAHASFAEDDGLRPLSQKGGKQMARICKALKGKGLIAPTRIWHSPLLRSIETAQLLTKHLSLNASFEEQEGLAPYDNPTQIVEKINRTHEPLMIVGHEPNLSFLASLLLTGTEDFAQIVFAKASLLRLSRLVAGKQTTPWHIEWHINHKLFK